MVEDRRPYVLTVSIVAFVLASVFVGLRFMSRIFVVKKVAIHDYLMLLAWFVDFGFSFSLFYGTSQGLGLHERDIRAADRPELNHANYAFTVLYNPALMTVKTSILAFYLTLTSNDKILRWATYITLFVVNAAGLSLTFLNVFQCSPVRAGFDYPSPPHAHCINIITLYLSSSPVNISTDLAILFLPMPLLTHMRLPRKQKIILIVTFSFGFFTTIFDVVRIVYLQNAAISRRVALQSVHLQNGASADLSWYASLSFMWSVVEVNVSVICGCVPSLKPLVARLIPKLIKDTTDLSYLEKKDTPARDQPFPVASASGSPTSPRSPHLPPQSRFQSQSDGSKELAPANDSNATDRSHRDSDNLVDMADILGAPAARPPDVENTTAGTSDTTYPRRNVFFGFVNMEGPDSMLKMNRKESLPPIALVTILFFLWGFAYGFLDVLNTQFAKILNLSDWDSLGFHGAYFGGYLTSPLTVGRPVLKKWGFKMTFMTGLCFYACGSLVFWPSAVLTSVVAFTISNFVVGFGLGILETAANPFISLCGPLEDSEIRLNLSQGIQAIGSVISPLLAQNVLFKNVKTVARLVDVQWTYLAIALFDVLLAVAFYYLPIPEASDEDLIELANLRRDVNQKKVLGFPVVYVTLALGVWSQFFYVAGQEVLGTSFEMFVSAADIKHNVGPFEYLTIGHSVFAFGRFLTALALCFLKPRWILLISYTGMVVFSILCTKAKGPPAVVMSLLIFFFESGAFSTIFALTLRGTAQHTKTAASLLATAIGGGVFFPFAQYSAALSHNLFCSYNVLVALFAAGAIFPVYLNLVPAAKKQVDPIPNEYIRRHHRHRKRHHGRQQRQEEEDEEGEGEGVEEARHGPHHHPQQSAESQSPSPLPSLQKQLSDPDIVHREKENISRCGVFSRPRSLVDDPLSAIQLPEFASIFPASTMQ